MKKLLGFLGGLSAFFPFASFDTPRPPTMAEMQVTQEYKGFMADIGQRLGIKGAPKKASPIAEDMLKKPATKKAKSAKPIKTNFDVKTRMGADGVLVSDIHIPFKPIHFIDGTKPDLRGYITQLKEMGISPEEVSSTDKSSIIRVRGADALRLQGRGEVSGTLDINYPKSTRALQQTERVQSQNWKRQISPQGELRIFVSFEDLGQEARAVVEDLRAQGFTPMKTKDKNGKPSLLLKGADALEVFDAAQSCEGKSLEKAVHAITSNQTPPIGASPRAIVPAFKNHMNPDVQSNGQGRRPRQTALPHSNLSGFTPLS